MTVKDAVSGSLHAIYVLLTPSATAGYMSATAGYMIIKTLIMMSHLLQTTSKGGEKEWLHSRRAGLGTPQDSRSFATGTTDRHAY